MLPVLNVIGDDHLPFPWDQCRREGMGELDVHGGRGGFSGGAKHVGEGRVRRLFHIHELVFRSL